MPVYQRRHPHYLHSASRFRIQTHIAAVTAHYTVIAPLIAFVPKYICTIDLT
jgi:hypothetical protein